MTIKSGRFKVDCQARIEEAHFYFEKGSWEIKGRIDFIGPDGFEFITGKSFSHSYFGFDEGYKALEALLERKCGEDLDAKEEVWHSLKKQ